MFSEGEQIKAGELFSDGEQIKVGELFSDGEQFKDESSKEKESQLDTDSLWVMIGSEIYWLGVRKASRYFLNFNRGPALGIRIFSVSLSNNGKLSSSIPSSVKEKKK